MSTDGKVHPANVCVWCNRPFPDTYPPALVNFWRSGGRELAEWAIRQGYNPELNAAIDAARAKEGK